MAITFPRTDVLTALSVADINFRLIRRQEISRTAGGITLAKDLGPALWAIDVSTTPALHVDAIEIEAIMASLDGSIGTFLAHDVRRPFPASDPTGAHPATVQIRTLSADTRLIGLKGLPANFVLTRGDYLSFLYGADESRALHQVMETTTASAAGNTNLFEVRPHIRPGAEVDTNVSLKRASAVFRLDPNSVQMQVVQTVASSLSFTAMQVL